MRFKTWLGEKEGYEPNFDMLDATPKKPVSLQRIQGAMDELHDRIERQAANYGGKVNRKTGKVNRKRHRFYHAQIAESGDAGVPFIYTVLKRLVDRGTKVKVAVKVFQGNIVNSYVATVGMNGPMPVVHLTDDYNGNKLWFEIVDDDDEDLVLVKDGDGMALKQKNGQPILV